ncbi:response regulator [Paenibacillus piri]|uniref:Response regulator n=1 Tax=Paenibacillus piri TaxID=2547395 RepID=A0A4R5K8A0_9BACL|nr:response regulator [Paenibacillus piri]TDF89809.1 response regulator [Paenibacillus piri]
MYKVVVVDDEMWIRQGIINAICWEEHGLVLAGEAEDGDDALDIVEKNPPDIALIDMNMPGTDGVGLIRKLKLLSPDTFIIIISGYSNFEYTKEAILSRVFDYVLKPLNKDELNAILHRCTKELELQRLRKMEDGLRNELLEVNHERLIEPLIRKSAQIHYSGYKESDFYQEFGTYQSYFACVVIIDDTPTAVQEYGGKEHALLQARSMVSGKLVGLGVGCIGMVDPEKAECVLVVFGNDLEPKLLINALKQSLNWCEKEFPVSVSIGVGEQMKSPLELHQSYKQAVQAIRMKKAASRYSILVHIEGSQEQSVLYSTQLEHVLLSAIQAGNREQALEAFRKLLDHLLAAEPTIYSLQRNLVILLGETDKILSEVGVNLEQIRVHGNISLVETIRCSYNMEELKLWFNSLIEQSIESVQKKNRKGMKNIIEDIVQHVREGYFKSLSIDDYARKYNLNSNYLRRVFKSETGKTFLDVLTEIRIVKAKELLRDSDMKIHEVGQYIGYEDYRNFYLVFKKVTGKSPGEFKKLT